MTDLNNMRWETVEDGGKLFMRSNMLVGNTVWYHHTELTGAETQDELAEHVSEHKVRWEEFLNG